MNAGEAGRRMPSPSWGWGSASPHRSVAHLVHMLSKYSKDTSLSWTKPNRGPFACSWLMIARGRTTKETKETHRQEMGGPSRSKRSRFSESDQSKRCGGGVVYSAQFSTSKHQLASNDLFSRSMDGSDTDKKMVPSFRRLRVSWRRNRVRRLECSNS